MAGNLPPVTIQYVQQQPHLQYSRGGNLPPVFEEPKQICPENVRKQVILCPENVQFLNS
jgi:hypothetical protein